MSDVGVRRTDDVRAILENGDMELTVIDGGRAVRPPAGAQASTSSAQVPFDPDDIRGVVLKLPSADAFDLKIGPLRLRNHVLDIAVLDDSDDAYLNDIKMRVREITGLEVGLVEVRTREQIFDILNDLYPAEQRTSAAQLLERDGITLWKYIQETALRRHCQDFHIEPLPDGKGGVVRFVIDNRHDDRNKATPNGERGTAIRLSENEYLQVCRRIRSEAEMPEGPGSRLESIRLVRDVASADGRVLRYKIHTGETFSLRVLGNAKYLRPLDQLGMSQAVQEGWMAAVAAPEGLHMVVGPPSSGKNTAVIGSIAELPLSTRNDITIEHPIEIIVDGLKQIEVSSDKDALKQLEDLLSGRPTLVYITEMKSEDMARAVLSAGRTGFQVVTTGHAPNALMVPLRMLDLNVPIRSSASTIKTVLASRLVARLCDCSKPRRLTPKLREYFKPRFARLIEADDASALRGPGDGCERCAGTGYKDMIGVFELLRFTEEVENAFASGLTPRQVLPIAREQGYIPMLEAGIDYVIDGTTSMAQILSKFDTGVYDRDA